MPLSNSFSTIRIFASGVSVWISGGFKLLAIRDNLVNFESFICEQAIAAESVWHNKTLVKSGSVFTNMGVSFSERTSLGSAKGIDVLWGHTWTWAWSGSVTEKQERIGTKHWHKEWIKTSCPGHWHGPRCSKHRTDSGMMHICHMEDLASHAALYLTGYDFSNILKHCGTWFTRCTRDVGWPFGTFGTGTYGKNVNELKLPKDLPTIGMPCDSNSLEISSTLKACWLLEAWNNFRVSPATCELVHFFKAPSVSIIFATLGGRWFENRTCKLLIISFRCAWFVLATEATRRYSTPLHTVSYTVLVKQQGVVSIQGGYHIRHIKTIKTYSQNHDLLANWAASGRLCHFADAACTAEHATCCRLWFAVSHPLMYSLKTSLQQGAFMMSHNQNSSIA